MSDTVFKKQGDLLDYTPAADVKAGALVFRGGVCGQVTNDCVAGALGALRFEGVIRVTKDTATVLDPSLGAKVHWDATNKLAITDATQPFIGIAVGGGANGDAYVDVLMNVSHAATLARTLRVRVTTAQVNAGLTLLPALAGRKYRVHDVALIAIGGAATAATTVDILATQSAASVKLLAAAVAGLTQSAVLRAGATNAAVLADGASFVPNDVNTAITIAKTGSALATATNIDVLLTYSVE